MYFVLYRKVNLNGIAAERRQKTAARCRGEREIGKRALSGCVVCLKVCTVLCMLLNNE